MAIGHPLPFSSNVTLISGDLRNLRRPGAEGGAAYSPVAISLALEILEEDVPPLRRRVGRHLFGAAFQEQEFVVAHQAIAPHAILRLGGAQANGVLQPARQFSFDLRGAVVLDRELQHCSGQRRIIRVERDEWGKSFKPDVKRRGLVLVLDVADGVFAYKGNVVPVIPIQRAFLCLAPAYKPQRESLLQWRSGLQRFGVMLRPSADPRVENIPMPQLAVATQVELPRADTAHRHPDLRQIRPAQPLPST